jgi:putative transposase
MARPLRITYPDAFYHITSRGNEQKPVFKSRKDRIKFLEYLESATERYNAVIHAYCLMDNHYHLLLETPSGNLSRIMAHINGAYTAYFNRKRDRAGHLFQGRYKAIVVEADEYAKELSRYIHLNPVRAKIVELPEGYEWSSYIYYIGRKKKPEWLNTDFILGYFGRKVKESQRNYKRFVSIFVDKKYESPLKEVFGSTILGTQEFIGFIKDKYISKQKADKDLPALKVISDRTTTEDIINQVDKVIKDDKILSRNIKIYLSWKHTGNRLDDIGEHFGIGGSGVCQAGRRISERIMKDKSLAKIINKIERSICQ